REAIADTAGWVAFVLTVGAVALLARTAGRPVGFGLVAPGVLAVAAMLALGTASRDAGGWLTFHSMMVALAAAAGVCCCSVGIGGGCGRRAAGRPSRDG